VPDGDADDDTDGETDGEADAEAVDRGDAGVVGGFVDEGFRTTTTCPHMPQLPNAASLPWRRQ